MVDGYGWEEESGAKMVKQDPEAGKQVRDGNPMGRTRSYRTAGMGGTEKE